MSSPKSQHWKIILDEGKSKLDIRYIIFEKPISKRSILNQLKSFNWMIPLEDTLLQTFKGIQVRKIWRRAENPDAINLSSPRLP